MFRGGEESDMFWCSFYAIMKEKKLIKGTIVMVSCSLTKTPVKCRKPLMTSVRKPNFMLLISTNAVKQRSYCTIQYVQKYYSLLDQFANVAEKNMIHIN